MFLYFQTLWQAEKKTPNNVVFFLRNWILRSFLQDFVSFLLNSLESSTVTWAAQSLANTAWFQHFAALWDISQINFFLYSLFLPHPFLNFQVTSCRSLCKQRGGGISHPKATSYGMYQSMRYLVLHPAASPAPPQTLPGLCCFAPRNGILRKPQC